MNFGNQLKQDFPSRVEFPAKIAEIPPDSYVVYILTINNDPIIVGHGKKNRARVIFDDKDPEAITGHIKAMKVRLHKLFGNEQDIFGRCLIRCKDKKEAKEIEHTIHLKYRGNSLAVPKEIEEKLLSGLPEDSPVRMVLRMALCSAFDGISDLKRWRQKGILGNEIWKQITQRLKLRDE